MSESSMAIDFSAPVPSDNREIQRLLNDVFKTPIKNRMMMEIEEFNYSNNTQLTLSLKFTSSVTIDRRLSSQHRYAIQKSIDDILKISERQLWDDSKKYIIETLARSERTIPENDTLLYGMPFRIVDDLEVEDGALIILSPKKYHELREKEADSRQGWIFTR